MATTFSIALAAMCVVWAAAKVWNLLVEIAAEGRKMRAELREINAQLTVIRLRGSGGEPVEGLDF